MFLHVGISNVLPVDDRSSLEALLCKMKGLTIRTVDWSSDDERESMKLYMVECDQPTRNLLEYISYKLKLAVCDDTLTPIGDKDVGARLVDAVNNARDIKPQVEGSPLSSAMDKLAGLSGDGVVVTSIPIGSVVTPSTFVEHAKIEYGTGKTLMNENRIREAYRAYVRALSYLVRAVLTKKDISYDTDDVLELYCKLPWEFQKIMSRVNTVRSKYEDSSLTVEDVESIAKTTDELIITINVLLM